MTTVWVVPFGKTTLAVTLSAVLGPPLVIVTVAVITKPGVLLAGALIVMPTLALLATGVTSAVVLLPGVGSGVWLAPAAVLVTLLVLAVTVALSTKVRVWFRPKLAVVAVAPPALLALSTPPVTTGVPDSVRPALKMSVSVTFTAVLGPKLTSVTV